MSANLTSPHERAAFTSAGPAMDKFQSSICKQRPSSFELRLPGSILCSDLSLVAVTPLCMYTL
jgi:hypothetical protein